MTNGTYEFGPFRVNATERLLLREGQSVSLKPKVFDLLLKLVANSGHVLMKEELMKEVWPDSFVEEHNLAVSISLLRIALEDDHRRPKFIETVAKRGYRFVAAVKVVSDENGKVARQWPGVTNTNLPGVTLSELTSIAVFPFKNLSARA